MLELAPAQTLWFTSHSSQFGVICKLAEGTLSPIIQISNEDGIY